MFLFKNGIGSTTAGIADCKSPSVLYPRVSRNARLDILLLLFLVAFKLSHTLGAVARGPEAKPLPSTPPDDTDWTDY